MFVIPNNVVSFLEGLPTTTAPFIVALSGGADSLYLTYLLNTWCQKTEHTLIAVTVNHGLRPDAEQEALWVHQQMQAAHIEHHILNWEGKKPKTHIEEYAREKRYELLLDFCHQHNSPFLFLAHHQQDQAETFWTRLAHQSGLDGLGAMSPVQKREDIMLIRPLLDTPKEQIIQTLTQNHLKWVEDPMNQDTAYERVQWRKNQAALDKMGLTAKGIETTTKRLQRAKDALNFYTKQFLEKHLKYSLNGFLQLDEKEIKKQPLEIQIRVFMQMFRFFQTKPKIISLDSVEKLAKTMPKYATLAGCQWVISHHQVFLAPELKSLPAQKISAGKWTRWGAWTIFSNTDWTAEARCPTPRLKKVPYLIQRSCIYLPQDRQILTGTKKELEKKVKLDYKNKAPVIALALNEKDKT